MTKTGDTNDGVCDSDCSLREAIASANNNLGADQINIPAGVYTITIAGTDEDNSATGDFDITEDLTITGSDTLLTVIDGNQLDSVSRFSKYNGVDLSADNQKRSGCNQ